MENSAVEEKGVWVVKCGCTKSIGVYLFELRNGSALCQDLEDMASMLTSSVDGKSCWPWCSCENHLLRRLLSTSKNISKI